MNQWIRTTSPLIIAHRGYSRVAPENTMPAYQRAVAAGADMIEADVNITRDGVLVMMHDYFLGRTINGSGNVFDLSYAEVCKLDAGAQFNPGYTGTAIPTAEALIRMAVESGIMVCLEIKGGGPEQACVIAEKMMKLFAEYDILGKALVSSYFSEATALAKRLAPQLQVVREWLPDDAPIDFDGAMSQIAELHSPILLFDFAHLTDEVVSFFHSQDVALWTWNPYLEPDLERVIRMKVDGVMGDDPELARRVLARSTARSRK